jgi:hypothetical protein
MTGKAGPNRPEPEDLPLACVVAALAIHGAPDKPCRPLPRHAAPASFPLLTRPREGIPGPEAASRESGRTALYPRRRIAFMRRCLSRVLVAVCALVPALPAAAQHPWAAEVISYAPGTGAAPGYTDPQVVLGEPSRYNNDPNPAWSTAVTPFSSPYLPEQIVSIGTGGSLVVRFDQPVTNDPLNPFGVDLLVFGNAFFADPMFNGTAAGVAGNGRGLIEISADGLAWFAVAPRADHLYPTLGYSDLLDPYSVSPGAVPADFTRPVDPGLNPIGMTFGQIVAAYGGSGGGTGVDIGEAGLSEVWYVRVSNDGSFGTVEVDAFAAVAAVPSPSCAILLAAAMLARRRRKGPAGGGLGR